MSPKGTKNTSKWSKCEDCECFIRTKDTESHVRECPPSNKEWQIGYIQGSVLHSTDVHPYNLKELPRKTSTIELDNTVFMATSVMELCNISIGDQVMLTTKEKVIVKRARPTNEKTLVNIVLTKTALELDKIDSFVKVQRLTESPACAKEVIIEYVGKHPLTSITKTLEMMIKMYNNQRIFAIGNRICIPFCGRNLLFEIRDVKFDGRTESIADKATNRDLAEEFAALELSQSKAIQLFEAVNSTKWVVHKNEQEDKAKKVEFKLENIGGHSDLISHIKLVLDDLLGKYGSTNHFSVSKGILLFGPPGVGKTLIAQSLISEYNVNTVNIDAVNIISKSSGEMNAELKALLEDATLKAPSIILIDNIDALCFKKSSLGTEQERRVFSTLCNFFEDLRDTNAKVAVVATTSDPDNVKQSFRTVGKILTKFEVLVPTPSMRKDIISKILFKVQHTLTEENVGNISFVTNGFVGSDLEGLFWRAETHAKERVSSQNTTFHFDDLRITIEDVRYALTVVKPSVTKDVLDEVMNVRWSDIGGQKDLKLKLRQAIEWPLKYPEAYTRMGITPSKGVLMFGPPGCSKTMIAKALATESKLSFLNIKGSELFSKWVGESEKAVSRIFKKARQLAPSIVFIDEIDALGSERASSTKTSGSNVEERVLAEFLTELDGVVALENVALVAATNRPDRIDKALLRPGRLDQLIYVPLPDSETRHEIFSIKTKKMPIADDVKVQDLVKLTEGYSGAEIQAVCYAAAMKALEEDVEKARIITKDHFKSALLAVTPRTPAALIKLYNNFLCPTISPEPFPT